MLFQSLYSSRILALILLLLWMAVIFGFSALSGKLTEGTPPLWYFIERKGAHVFEYAVLLLLSFHFFTLSFRRETFPRLLCFSVVFALAYAATDELHQFFVPFRGARLSDVLIDGLGILIASSMISFFRKTKNRS